MKNTLLLILLLSANAYSQQFRFYIAFEDAAGTKDTAWFVWDESATYNIDYLYGEIPITVPADTFCVFFKHKQYNGSNLYTKTYSAPSSSTTFSSFIKTPTNGPCWYDSTYIAYPLTLRWDTSLLINNSLPFQIAVAGISNTSIITNDSVPGNFFLDLFSKGYVIIDPPNPYFDYVASNPLPAVVFFSKFPVNKPLNHDLNLNKNFESVRMELNYLLIENADIELIRVIDNTNNIVFEQFQPLNKINLNVLPVGDYILLIINSNTCYRKLIKIE